jgi:DNA-directed RNA polymerase specialized sigma24 family protein
MKLREETSLSGYLDLTDKISEYNAKIARMEDAAYDLPDGMPSVKKEKHHGDGRNPVVNDKLDLEKTRDRLERDQAAARRRIIVAINAVGDERIERMLYAYYIEGKSICEISLDERISYSHTNTLLHRGVKRMEAGE